MSNRKWGESFLKSGLPLEHLTVVILRSLGWDCRSHVEYPRPNREQEATWFELDVEADCDKPNVDTYLSLLIECKYHDLSRFWFFLPHEAGSFHYNDRVLNCGPLQTLAEPRSRSLLELAPCSTGGIVVSADGTKQDNAVHTAIQQLANGFVPHSMVSLFAFNLEPEFDEDDDTDYLPRVTAVIPMIVTNASIYRLKPDITDLDVIRQAVAPGDIADEVEWTWCYHDVSIPLLEQNATTLEEHKSNAPELIYKFPLVVKRMSDFDMRPSWIAIANVKTLKETVNTITDHFLSLQTLGIERVLRRRSRRRRRQ